MTGEIAEVADRSWQRAGSAVWEIADAAGGCWFVKRHSSGRFHQREVAACRHWTAALGPGRAPDLAAADSQMLAIVISGLPGQIAVNLRLAGDDEREMHRQAGELLRRRAACPRAGTASCPRAWRRPAASLGESVVEIAAVGFSTRLVLSALARTPGRVLLV